MFLKQSNFGLKKEYVFANHLLEKIKYVVGINLGQLGLEMGLYFPFFGVPIVSVVFFYHPLEVISKYSVRNTNIVDT